MAGTDDDVQRLLQARARREADAIAAENARVAAVNAKIARDAEIKAAKQAKWPGTYAMLRAIFDTWQPHLEGLGLDSSIGGAQPNEARYEFNFDRKDGRAYHHLSFALSDSNQLNVVVERFSDTEGTQRSQPTLLRETEEAARPYFNVAVTELENYEARTAGDQRRFRSERQMTRR